MGLLMPSSGFYRWNKGQKSDLSQFFGTNEFECHCHHVSCVEQKLNATFFQNLNAVRIMVGLPISVNRSYSCQAHQDDLTAQGYETAKYSQHVLGDAADITCSNLEVLKLISGDYFKAIGIGSTSIHVDGRTDKVRKWTYSKGM